MAGRGASVPSFEATTDLETRELISYCRDPKHANIMPMFVGTQKEEMVNESLLTDDFKVWEYPKYEKDPVEQFRVPTLPVGRNYPDFKSASGLTELLPKDKNWFLVVNKPEPAAKPNAFVAASDQEKSNARDWVQAARKRMEGRVLGEIEVGGDLAAEMVQDSWTTI